MLGHAMMLQGIRERIEVSRVRCAIHRMTMEWCEEQANACVLVAPKSARLWRLDANKARDALEAHTNEIAKLEAELAKHV